jgi:hypothetical protein
MYPTRDPIPLLPPEKSGKLRTYCPSAYGSPHSARFTAKVPLVQAIEFNWHDINTPHINSPTVWICYLDEAVVENKDRHIKLPIPSSPTDPCTDLLANRWTLINKDTARHIWNFLANSSSWILTNRGENWKEIPL